MQEQVLHQNDHGTIIQTGIILKWVWNKERLAINKDQKYFLLPDHEFDVNLLPVFLVCKKGQKEHRSAGIIVTIIFM